jgi:DNA-binding Lrp family transcriptional regulator
MTPAKPSLELLRSLTDEHVLRALMQERRLTRAEIAARTGISKPTVSESVKRLTQAGLLADTGERTSGRGRIGTYYGLADGLGVALVVGIAPEGIVAETIDVHGQVVAREVEHVQRPARPEQVTRALRTAARRAGAASPGPVRLAVVSAADPVERATGRLVHLPDAPFLLGELSPVHALARVVAGPVVVDNDVNWAARAERSAAAPGALDDFAYLYLGEGLGCAVVADGQVRRGHRGLAGEIAHLLVRGPQGRAVHFTEVFAELGLRQPQSPAIDVVALL